MDEIELSREQHRAIIAVDVLRLVHPGEGKAASVLYHRAVAELTKYLEPNVPTGDDAADDPNTEEYRK